MIWSEKCNNPKDGYIVQSYGSMKMNAPLGNYVYTIDELEVLAWWKK
jgi:hypothetical protein